MSICNIFCSLTISMNLPPGCVAHRGAENFRTCQWGDEWPQHIQCRLGSLRFCQSHFAYALRLHKWKISACVDGGPRSPSAYAWRAHAKLQNPTTIPSVRISNELEREKERNKEKKCHLWWPPMFMTAAQGQRTHSARTNLTIFRGKYNFF